MAAYLIGFKILNLQLNSKILSPPKAMHTKKTPLNALLLLVAISSETAFSSASSLASPPLEIDIPSKNSLLIFTNSSICENLSVEAFVFSKKSGNLTTTKLDEIEGQGASRPTIESVFTDKFNKDDTKDLAVLIKWKTENSALNTRGNYYELRIYDGESLKRSSNISSRDFESERSFPPGFSGVREGSPVQYQFKSAKEIRDELKKRGR